jgi:type II secretory ATPase GspE/PulE/Tfp pilus assembly ATPase PilB-like protein
MERISLQKENFSLNAGAQYRREFISRRGAVKLAENDREVRIGVIEGSGTELLEYLEGYHFPKEVVFYSVGRAEFASFIGETAGGVDAVGTADIDAAGINAAGADAGGTDAAGMDAAGMDAVGTAGRFTLDRVITQDAPVIHIINALCIEAIRLEASDIHIEARSDSVQIRYRIDGVLKPVKKLAPSFFRPLSNRIKIMADMNTMEQRLPQDGRITVSVENKTIDLRVSIIPVMDGESIVLRIFNKSAGFLGLDQLGFFPEDLERIRGMVRQPHGLILLTGPTGSGKTSTLHALLGTLPADNVNIITIEDPVERIIPGINQVQINDAINLSFEGMLRRVLRQDPNVIMVGEIRDGVTAELALRSALTGHLILSTLHTNDSVSVIHRLCNMGIEPYLIAAVLRGSIAQRLVRKLCPHCKKEISPDKKTQSLLAKYGIKDGILFKEGGCGACGFTGYKGRTVVNEIFTVDSAAEEMILQKRPAAEIARNAKKNGMKTMAQDALEKALRGITALSEIEREALL